MKPSAYKKCLKLHKARGHAHSEAEHLCRHARPAFNPAPMPPATSELEGWDEADPAAAKAPGSRSQGTSLGTNAVVKPDTMATASDWYRSLGRASLQTVDRATWDTHAQRSGLDPEAADDGWSFLHKHFSAPKIENRAAEATLAIIDAMRPPTAVNVAAEKTLAKIEAERAAPPADVAAEATLRKIFGERGDWAGMNVPLVAKKRVVQPVDDEQSGDKVERTMAPIKMHQAPLPGNEAGIDQIVKENPGFPFGSWSAKKVWEVAQYLILTEPLANPGEIIAQAIEKSGVLPADIPPEDDRLLTMAVEYLQNGPMKSAVRTGGAPGGPMRTPSRDSQ